MKRVEIERQAIVAALEKERNISEAARALGAARRTLQSRMRDYQIPPGAPGRPRELLPYSSTPSAFSVLALAGVIGLGVYVWRRDRSQQIAGEVKPECLRGLDVISPRR